MRKELRDTLLEKVMSEDCSIGLVDAYGTRYIVDFAYVKGSRSAMIRSTWIIKTGESAPCLTSCFIL